MIAALFSLASWTPEAIFIVPEKGEWNMEVTIKEVTIAGAVPPLTSLMGEKV